MTIYITKEAYLKMKYFTQLCDLEISGLGKVISEKIGNQRIFVIHDIEIFDQEVSAGSSTLDEDALAKFLFEKTKAGEKMSEYRVWWHSHAKMESFFSVTDTDTIETSTEFPWLISIVTNHANVRPEDLECRFDIYDPIKITEEDIMVELLPEADDEKLKEQCQKEIDEKVKEEVTSWYGEKKKYRKESWEEEVDPIVEGIPPIPRDDPFPESYLGRKNQTTLKAGSTSKGKGKSSTRKGSKRKRSRS